MVIKVQAKDMRMRLDGCQFCCVIYGCEYTNLWWGQILKGRNPGRILHVSYLGGFEHDLGRVVEEHERAFSKAMRTHQHGGQLDVCLPRIHDVFRPETIP